MALPPASFDAFRLLLNIRCDYFVQRPRCKKFFLSYAVSNIEMFVQEDSIDYLDLALHFPRWKNWESLARTQIQHSIPVLIREFLLAEKVDQNLRFTSQFQRFLDHNTEVFRRKMKFFLLRLFTRFERLLFNEITDKHEIIKMQNVCRYLRAYKVFQVDRFDSMYRFLIRLCIPVDCQLTFDVLRTLCDTNDKKQMFYRILNERILLALIGYAKIIKFDFWGIWNGSSNLAIDFIHDFMNMGVDQKYSRILLKFGFPYRAKCTGYNNRGYFLQDLVFDGERPVVRTLEPLFGQTEDSHSTRMMLIMDTFVIFGNFYTAVDEKDCVRTLVYLTRSLPDPYVTASELYSKMQEVVVPEFLPQLKAITEKYSDTTIFDQEHKTHSPRRLKHLCRVVIRKSLAGNFKLLHGIEELNIPATVKLYLKLER